MATDDVAASLVTEKPEVIKFVSTTEGVIVEKTIDELCRDLGSNSNSTDVATEIGVVEL